MLAPVYAHNDLLSGNVLSIDGETEGGGGGGGGGGGAPLPRLILIDFEYADTNYAGYDLANNICEHAGFSCDWQRNFPAADVRRELVALYAQQAARARGEPAWAPADVDVMAAWVDRFCLASHFWWGLWALVQSVHSPIDFPFEAYFPKRAEGYLRHKAEFFPGEPLPTLFDPLR